MKSSSKDPERFVVHSEIDCLIWLLQRLEEARIALFSKWSSAALAWNREETASGLLPPSPAFYAHVLVSCVACLVPRREASNKAFGNGWKLLSAISGVAAVEIFCPWEVNFWRGGGLYCAACCKPACQTVRELLHSYLAITSPDEPPKRMQLTERKWRTLGIEWRMLRIQFD